LKQRDPNKLETTNKFVTFATSDYATKFYDMTDLNKTRLNLFD